MSKEASLDAETLRTLLQYSPITGEFIWLISTAQSVKIGTRAGGQGVRGYRSVKVLGKLYRENRLAWLYMTGEWPRREIDHRNGVKNDNRWANLREATHAENCQNLSDGSKNNSSGRLGVSFRKDTGKWRSYITVYGKRTYLGLSDTVEEACSLYLAAKARLHTFQPSPRGAV